MITILRGASGCGKSTLAISSVKAANGSLIRVNRDSIRKMLYGDDLSRYYTDKKLSSYENTVTEIQFNTIREALKKDLNVVIDDTNLDEKTVNKIVTEFSTETTINTYVMPIVDLTELKYRVSKRDGINTNYIEKQYNKHLALSKGLTYNTFPKKEFTQHLPSYKSKAIIVDIDGTLAEKGDRDIYDGSKVYLDKPIVAVVELVKAFRKNDTKIIVVSGRDEKYRDVTHDWLVKHVFEDEDFALFMRKENDKRRDSIVKSEIFNTFINQNYNVVAAVDDRLQVLEQCWSKHGIFTFNVNQQNIRF